MKRLIALMMCALSLGAAAQLPDYVPTDGLEVWLPFESSIVNYASGTNVGSGNVDAYDEGISGQCATFSSIGMIDFYESIDFSERTIVTWMRVDAEAWQLAFASDYPGLEFGMTNIGFGAPSLPNTVGAQAGAVTGNQQLSLGEWVHVALSYDPDSTRIYFNGVLSLVAESNPVASNGGNANPRLGADSTQGRRFSGAIDEFGIWSKVLSASEILALYVVGLPLSGCTDPSACNFNQDAVTDDNSCDLFTCKCLEGTIWSEELGGCIVANPADINLDGCVQLNDLLDLLSAYGDCGAEESAWQCGDPLDYQGYDYETVQIGEQCWFAENARYLPAVSPVLLGSEDDGMPHAYVYGYDGANTSEAVLEPNYQTYGGLYNYEAIEAWGLCPTGWSIPNQIEWDILTTNNSVLDCVSTSWFGTNLTGLDFLPGGDRDGDQGANAFNNLSSYSLIWLEGDNPESPVEVGVNNESWYNYGIQSTSFGLSVRCIKD